jgi:hypothetical protein
MKRRLRPGVAALIAATAVVCTAARAEASETELELHLGNGAAFVGYGAWPGGFGGLAVSLPLRAHLHVSVGLLGGYTSLRVLPDDARSVWGIGIPVDLVLTLRDPARGRIVPTARLGVQLLYFDPRRLGLLQTAGVQVGADALGGLRYDVSDVLALTVEGGIAVATLLRGGGRSSGFGSIGLAFRDGAQLSWAGTLEWRIGLTFRL